jgi:hypothetical protein
VLGSELHRNRVDSASRCYRSESIATTPPETRNRKPLQPRAAFSATWEIRFGPDNRFRVLYDIVEGERAVQILAIGVKRSNRLVIGGEEIDS